MKQRRLVVISLDSLGFADLNEQRDLTPNLNRLIAQGTWVKKVRGIFPTLTYPSHTSIITGQYPAVHGIVNNTKLQPTRKSPDWYWYQRKEIKAATLYDVAHQAGLKTAAFLWPVTAGSKIDWNVAEIFPNRIWTNQVLVSLKASSPWFLYQMNRKFGHLRHGIKQPWLDDFVTAMATWTLQHKQPDLTLIHLVDMDSMRHRYGVRSKQAKEALQRLDARVGRIIQATRDAGTFDQTDFVCLGDHYQIDVDQMIHLNTLFAQKGWLRPIKDQQTFKNDWRVMAKTCDGETYVYVKPGVDQDEIRRAIAGVKGIEKIYDGAQAVKLGTDPHCAFLVEAKAGYYFTDESQRPAVVEPVLPAMMGQPDRYRGVHGYGADKPNYFTTAVFYGPDIKPGATVEHAALVDEGPTFAQLLGLHYPKSTAGKPIKGILRK
ncbi:alkaline phosphatase family protein [Limosilactobacillus mucosae]|uniref:Alkaline phosphatase family protein n=1 Tax=Limosilactobacillus mucosae TaxID=97478 RepID=A0AAJ1M9T0_LIMMU|nr:alkaline phosphatase family protein [Limosilactobacillus mucosae]MDC2829241.1 alkaline phosphatase family protein [Limosilactobacillus mucosae]MDC2836924.1 alkaline phosphatase family protein [Limosilactobacillus mucosae]MDC2849139.1 alkaline phosphatase family protein [Limosilactobacillus mucosae]MDC2852836.1 alkaline phosphatase family protein [Limosilactobacillus mucosae]